MALGCKLDTGLQQGAHLTQLCLQAIDKIQESYPDARVYAAGFSLGSMILGRYLASSHAGEAAVSSVQAQQACCFGCRPQLMSSWASWSADHQHLLYCALHIRNFSSQIFPTAFALHLLQTAAWQLQPWSAIPSASLQLVPA